MTIDQNMLGAAIKEVRLARGLTQSQLAKQLGFSSGGVALIEQGKRAVSTTTLNAIADTLEIPPSCLTILGSRSSGKSKPVTDFVESLKDLISTLIAAQRDLAAEDRSERTKKKPPKATVKSRNNRHSNSARDAGSPGSHRAKRQPAKQARHRVAAGR